MRSIRNLSSQINNNNVSLHLGENTSPTADTDVCWLCRNHSQVLCLWVSLNGYHQELDSSQHGWKQSCFIVTGRQCCCRATWHLVVLACCVTLCITNRPQLSHCCFKTCRTWTTFVLNHIVDFTLDLLCLHGLLLPFFIFILPNTLKGMHFTGTPPILCTDF